MWYYLTNGQQQGPVSEEQFGRLITAGAITLDTLVWKEGRANWEPLAQVRKDLSSNDACEVCHRLVGSEHLVNLGGIRVCEACKPAAVQKMREGVPVISSTAPRRPVMVWVISIFYFITTPLGILSIILMVILLPRLSSSGLPMAEPQRHYLQSMNVTDYILAAFGHAVRLTGAIYLFRLRRQALYYFIGVLVLTLLNYVYQILFKNWLGVIGSQPLGYMSAGIGIIFGLGIEIAIIWYVWHLKNTKVLR
jgi:hypothetical protein